MPIYVMLTKATDEGAKMARERIPKSSEKPVNKGLNDAGIKVLHQYMLLGEYDWINVLEAPSDVDVLKEAVNISSLGTVRTLTMPAVSISELKEIMK